MSFLFSRTGSDLSGLSGAIPWGCPPWGSVRVCRMPIIVDLVVLQFEV